MVLCYYNSYLYIHWGRALIIKLRLTEVSYSVVMCARDDFLLLTK